MPNRYKYRKIFKNDLEQYDDLFYKKNLKHIFHYSTAQFSYVNANQYVNLSIISYVWKEGDRYFKLAERFYGDATLWWVIAKFNLKPTESHVQIGDIIEIPTPLDKVLSYMKG